MTNYQKRIAGKGLEIQTMAKNAGHKVEILETNQTPSTTQSVCKNPFYVDYKGKLREHVCQFITMKIDNQEMNIEEIDEEKLKLLEIQLKENFFKSTREIVGNIRTCEGKAGLAILPYMYQGVQKLFIDPVRITSTTEDIFNHLVAITTQSVKRYQHVNGWGTLTTDWVLKGDKVVLETTGYDEITKEVVKQADWNVSFQAKRTLDINFIPVAIFKNNWEEKGELCGYEDMLDLIDVFYNTIGKERINSRTRLLLNENILQDDVDKLKAALRNDDQDIVSFNGYNATLGAPIQDISTTGKMAETIEALHELEAMLFKLLRLPTPQEAEGKNNKHNLEVSQKEASTRDMIEAKKSLQEPAYDHFIYLLMMMNTAYGIIVFSDEEIMNKQFVWEESQTEEEMQAAAQNGQQPAQSNNEEE